MRKSVRGTHPEILDRTNRLILANELLVLRYQLRLGMHMSRDELWLVKMGLETALRRVEDVQRNGLEVVYKQNYES